MEEKMLVKLSKSEMWKLFQTASDQIIILGEISRKLDVYITTVETLETKNIELGRRFAKMEDCYVVSAKTDAFLKPELVTKTDPR